MHIILKKEQNIDRASEEYERALQVLTYENKFLEKN